MATPIIMPRQGQSVESCIITKWHKRPGDAVSEGDIIFTYETDKATFDEEAKVSGSLLAAFFDEGDDVPCLVNVCVVGGPGEDAQAYSPHAGAPANASVPAPAAAPVIPAPEKAPASEAAQSAGGQTFVSPRARQLALKTGIDPALATPTGPNGRVIERDIQALADSGVIALRALEETPAKQTLKELGDAVSEKLHASSQEREYTDIPLTGVRKAIAKSMTVSLSTIPQLTHHLTFDATNILAYRAMLKEKGEAMGLNAVTIGDIVAYAVSRTLLNHPDLNAHYLDTGIRRFTSVNLGVAVDTPRGLLVPTLFGASSLSLQELSARTKEVAQMAISGKIAPELLSGASFTVSNLGAFGIESFTPVINPPQTGILGVNTITERVRSRKDGSAECYKAMGLSLTYDHRAVDGAPASRFLQELQKNLENFSMLLAK